MLQGQRDFRRGVRKLRRKLLRASHFVVIVVFIFLLICCVIIRKIVIILSSFGRIIGTIIMDEIDNEQNSETHLKAGDDNKKRRWNSFRRGKKQIKKLWKSKRSSKHGDEEHSSHSGDSHDNVAYENTNGELPVSPMSDTSSVDPIPSIMLRRPSRVTDREGNNSSPDYMDATTDEEYGYFADSKENNDHNGPKSPARNQLSLATALLNRQESYVRMIIIACMISISVIARAPLVLLYHCKNHHPLDHCQHQIQVTPNNYKNQHPMYLYQNYGWFMLS